ncbi:MAG: FAD-dependent monooxygenase [Gammaproteobacteria bacterium]|nr:FAD-dependent monooxygenase [Gammaproteobacteria bacterium]
MKNILISGAGIAGLCLARQLKKQNIAYTLIEKRETLDAIGAGIALPANAVRALRYMGLSESLNQMHQVKKIIYARPNGRVISQASLLNSPLNRDKFVALKRSKLLSILEENIKDDIHFDTSIMGMKQLDSGVEVMCSNAKLNGHYDAVIGADGLYSTVRDLGFEATDLVDLGVTNWRWTSEHSTRDIQPTYMLGMKSIFLAYPIGRNQIYCYLHRADKHNQYGTPDKAHANISELFKHYQGVAEPLLKKLPDMKDIYTGRLRSVPKPLFSQGDLALIGDASNACSPMLQQGAACAFEDAIVLSELLAKFSVREAFKHYQTLRYQRVNWIVKTSDDGIKSFVKINSRWSLMARNLLIKKKGPLNVLGWKHLLSSCPLDGVKHFIESADMGEVIS